MPQRTIALLERLVAAGFTDQDFRIIHHMPSNTIKAHLNYCAKQRAFSGEASTNALVRERLVLVFGAYFGGGFAMPARPGVFAALAEAAVSEIPKLSK